METAEKPKIVSKSTAVRCHTYGELIAKEKRALMEVNFLNTGNRYRKRRHKKLK